MAQKIALDELERQIEAGDIGPEEIGRYFRTNESKSPKPFFPGLELDPDTVEVPADRAVQPFRVDFPFPVNFWIAQQRSARDLEYREHIRRGYKPVIVSRGDSWFLHPKLSETIDYLRGAYAIHSFDYPGDTLDDIVNDKADWLAAIRSEGASIFLLSGGGNDLLGGGALAKYLHPFDPRITDPGQYLTPDYHALIDLSLAKIRGLIEEVLKLSRNVRVICHGYDHPIPNNGQWLGGPMNSIHITDRALQKRITDYMVDAYNVRLHALVKPYTPRVYHLSLCGVVTTGWDDELHPTEAGFRQIASHLRAVIDRLSPAA